MTMTREQVIAIIKNFQQLANQYAQQGDVDTVNNINNSIADVTEKYKDILN